MFKKYFCRFCNIVFGGSINFQIALLQLFSIIKVQKKSAEELTSEIISRL